MTFDDVVDIAQVVSMFAALIAIWFAWQTVIETKALRREDRIARLTELIADVGEWSSHGESLQYVAGGSAVSPSRCSDLDPRSGRAANPSRRASAFSTSTGPS